MFLCSFLFKYPLPRLELSSVGAGTFICSLMSFHYLVQCLAPSKCSINILKGRKDGRKGERKKEEGIERRKEGILLTKSSLTFSLLTDQDWWTKGQNLAKGQIPARTMYIPLPLKLLPFDIRWLQGIAAPLFSEEKQMSYHKRGSHSFLRFL